MNPANMMIAAGAACILILGACAEDVPTANPVTQERSVAKAPTPSPDIVIGSTVSACVNNSSGTIKIVAEGAACAGNELALSLSTGPSSSGISGHEIVQNTIFLAPGFNAISVLCPAGKKILGGGFDVPGDVTVFRSLPVLVTGRFFDSWQIHAHNPGADRPQRTIAICATGQ